MLMQNKNSTQTNQKLAIQSLNTQRKSIKFHKAYLKQSLEFSIIMYTFPQQQKIFKDLLSNNPSNKQCADCGTVGPTWASLNFGVFLCSNCSGAHRALGPTITRVKSTKLDQWQKEWMECMYVGNKQVNEYWESDLGMAKKPKMGASQQELIKYAGEKYVKKRYVKNPSEEDPLTRYKNGTYVKNQPKEESKPVQKKTTVKIQQQIPKLQRPAQVQSNIAVQNQNRNVNLIEFEFPQSPKLQVKSQTQEVNRNNNVMPMLSPPTQVARQSSENHSHPHHQAIDDDEFTEFTEHGTSFTNTTTDKALTYEELIAKKSTDSGDVRYNIPMSLHHTQSASNIPHYNSPHFNINMNGHTHHVGGHNNQSQPQSFNHANLKQLYSQPQQHNPYQSVGYLPTNNMYQQQQYNSLYNGQAGQFTHNQQGSMGQMGQNLSINQQSSTNFSHINTHGQNNNFGSLNTMSNQQNLNPSNMPLGGYHNQGYGSHGGHSQPAQKQQEFKWNDFSGWQGMHQNGGHQQQQQNQQQHQQNQQQPSQQQQGQSSWLDEWK